MPASEFSVTQLSPCCEFSKAQSTLYPVLGPALPSAGADILAASEASPGLPTSGVHSPCTSSWPPTTAP